MSTRQLLLDSAEKIFADLCDQALLDAAEAGQFPDALWQTLCENGFHLLATADSGAELADAFALFRLAGRHALPLPLAETLLANRWLHHDNDSDSDALRSIGIADTTQLLEIAWGRRADRILGVRPDNQLLHIEPGELTPAQNIAFEPRDRATILTATEITTGEPVYEFMALSRVALAAGALTRILEFGIHYAGERQQFGRPLSRFQSVQHNLAVAAAEVAAANRACDAAIAALGSARLRYEVAAAKARSGEAIGIVTETIHQLFGAMGFTHEHLLHHFTRRLWAWRDEYGNESYWQTVLGQRICADGADGVWDFIATDQ